MWVLYINMIRRLWRWHPKVALRYLPIVAKINSMGLSLRPILEIGSGSLGIAPYLGRSVTGLDIDFSGPNSDLLTKVYGSALDVPFANSSFDTVLLVDVLEHIPADKRMTALKEATRVARKLLVIAVPEGPLSQQEDRQLANYYKSIYHKEFPFYKQHLIFGLPQERKLKTMIDAACKTYKKKATIEVVGNVNMKLHNFLMKGWMTNNFLIDLIFRKLMLVAIPLYARMNNEPVYRKIFFVTLKP